MPRASDVLRPAIGNPPLAAGLVARMRGPGGYYNIGNLLGLVAGIALQVAGSTHGIGRSALDYLAGNAAALAMTVATVIFFCAGELYHRAWQAGEAPDGALDRLADLLSGIGAIALGCALWLLDQPLLAVTAGALHAFGKFASAAAPDGRAAVPGWPAGWPDPFRSMVVASRAPALLAAGADLWRTALAALTGAGPALPVMMPATLLACYLLWTRADLLLFRDTGHAGG